MAEALQQALENLNSQLAESGVTSFKLGVASPFDLKLLEEIEDHQNARFMTKETFDVLVSGIQGQGLSSLPFCYFDGQSHVVLSGNHRVKAARAADIASMLFLYTDRQMTKEEQIAVQLAHNQITGQDDPQVLKSLWNEIKDVGLKYLTGFDDDYFEKLKAIEFSPIKEAPLKFKTVSVLFLQEDLDAVDAAADLVEKHKGRDATLLAAYRDFDLFFEAVVQTKEKLGIINTATAIRKMAEITVEHLKGLGEDATDQTVQG